MPKRFRTVRELLHWEYAKLVAGSAVANRREFAFVHSVYKKLNSGEIQLSALVVENKLLIQNNHACAYCGAEGRLQWEHIIPRAMNGPDSVDNLVLACQACNLSKGSRDPYVWYSPDRLDAIPRVVLGKLLKMLYAEFEKHNVLDSEAYMRERQVARTNLAEIFIWRTVV
jgi:CRISPR/Cas system Type II protein with McrA/HNH and RuvC-like nuclease domain